MSYFPGQVEHFLRFTFYFHEQHMLNLAKYIYIFLSGLLSQTLPTSSNKEAPNEGTLEVIYLVKQNAVF